MYMQDQSLPLLAMSVHCVTTARTWILWPLTVSRILHALQLMQHCYLFHQQAKISLTQPASPLSRTGARLRGYAVESAVHPSDSKRIANATDLLDPLNSWPTCALG